MAKKHFKKALLSLALGCVLSGCVSNGQSGAKNISSNDAFSALAPNVNYVQVANDANDDSRFAALILQARSYVVMQDLAQANVTVEMLKSEAITPLQQDQIKIIEALIAYQSSNVDVAASYLDDVNVLTLPHQVAIYYYQLRSNVKYALYKKTQSVNDLIEAFNCKKELISLVSVTDRTTVTKQALNMLKGVSAKSLSEGLNTTDDFINQGFIEYALIDLSTSAELKDKLTSSWKGKYIDHPIALYLLGTNTVTSTDNTYSQGTLPNASQTMSLKDGDRVALLLPLTGRFAESVGKIAKLGITAAIQDRDAKINVDFYDTNVLSMQDIVNKAKSLNTKFIIGPVLKPEVEALIASDNTIPAIVLNEPSVYKANVYYFDLGPDYEGSSTARKLFEDAKKNPLVIASSAQKAQRAVEGFSSTWATTSLPLANKCTFNTVESVNKDLSTCLINKADAVYIAGTSREANAVKALLPRGLDVYLQASSFDGLNNSGLEYSLVGAIMGNMPWLLTESEHKASFMQIIPKANTQAQQIFAASYDAVNIAFNLGELKSSKSDVLYGLTGDIKISDKNLIEYKPMWYKLGSKLPGRGI